jgi:protein phosphatase PTC7
MKITPLCSLLSYALMCQFSTNKASPFEREAARYGIRYPGGKVDDVAIIMSLFVER